MMTPDIFNCKDRLDTDFFQSLCNDNIIYSHVSRLGSLNPRNDYSSKILLIRDGDTPTNTSIFNRYNFKKVFCQNLNCEPSDRIQCIPIGMESVNYTKKNGWDKFDVIKEIRQDKIEPDNLILMNFSISTNSTKRNQCYNSFKDKDYVTKDITIRLKHPSSLTKDEYSEFCRKVLRHKFVLCPEGNGIDTHRLWETLYLGRIPVVLHNHVNDSFSDLPILILEKWEDFETRYQDFLRNTIETKNYILDKLNFEYWRNAIVHT